MGEVLVHALAGVDFRLTKGELVVNAIIDLDEPRERWKGLGDGFRVEARVLVWEDPKVLFVPDGALFRSGEDFCAFVVEGDGRA